MRTLLDMTPAQVIRPITVFAAGAIVVGLVLALILSQPTRPTDPAAGVGSPALPTGSPTTTLSVDPISTQVPSPSASATSQGPSPTATAAPCCSAEPTLEPQDQLALSDAFWDYWILPPHPRPPFEATSLAENVSQAHLVVRGHVADLYIGEHWVSVEGEPALPLAYATVSINEVIQGTPVSRTPGFVEVGLGPASQELVDEIRAALPQEESLWFLMYELNIRPRPPQNDSEIAEFAYFASNDLQGVLRNIGGAVRVIRPEWTAELGPDHFPLQLQGTSFVDLIDDVRELAQPAPETHVPSP